MPWNEQLFGGWGMMLPWVPVAALVAVVFCLPSALWTRLGWRHDWLGWLISLLAAAATVGWLSSRNDPGYLAEHPLVLVGVAGPLVLAVVIPEVLAYPLSRRRPLKRLAIAAAISVAGSVAWLLAAAATGATPD
jgi:hypothetical protein